MKYPRDLLQYHKRIYILSTYITGFLAIKLSSLSPKILCLRFLECCACIIAIFPRLNTMYDNAVPTLGITTGRRFSIICHPSPPLASTSTSCNKASKFQVGGRFEAPKKTCLISGTSLKHALQLGGISRRFSGPFLLAVIDWNPL